MTESRYTEFVTRLEESGLALLDKSSLVYWVAYLRGLGSTSTRYYRMVEGGFWLRSPKVDEDKVARALRSHDVSDSGTIEMVADKFVEDEIEIKVESDKKNGRSEAIFSYYALSVILRCFATITRDTEESQDRPDLS